MWKQGNCFQQKSGRRRAGGFQPHLQHGVGRFVAVAQSELQASLGQWATFNPFVNFKRYADDFIITAKAPELLENKVKPMVREFLRKRGLIFSQEKTVITHIDDGIDFLGCSVRKYNGKLLTKPSKASVKAFLGKVRGIIKRNQTAKQQDLIARLNPVIRGWVNFHRFNVSARIFSYVDAQIFRALWKWAKRRHHNKGSYWIANRYFHRGNNRKWTFFVQWKREDGTTGWSIALFPLPDLSINLHLIYLFYYPCNLL